MLESLNVSTKEAAPLDADTSGVPKDQQVLQPAFITTASLGTFAGGSAVITVVWKVAIAIFDWDGRWFPGVLAGVLGLFFFWQALETGKLRGSAILAALLVAVANACILWSAAVGLDVGLNEAEIVDSAAH